MITYQFKLSPTKHQQALINQQIEVHRTLYNKCLAEKIDTYKQTGKSPSRFDQNKSKVKLFKGLSNHSALQKTIHRLDKTYRAFFRKSGFPRFKGIDRFRTIEYGKYGNGCKIRNGKLYLQYIGEIKVKFHRNIDHPIKTLSITKSDGGYFVNIICTTDRIINNSGSNQVGIDFGIQNTITCSDGNTVKTQYFSKNKHKQLARLSRKKNYKALAKVHRKIRNKRKDFNHKLSRKIVNSYNVICLENIQVQDIKSYKNINRKLFDIGINQLINYIKYKAESAGKYVVMVNPAYTTQTCNKCGNTQKLKLTERQYNCSCGYSENRDINAAKNILRLGLESLGIP